ncbi:methionine aminopeptidase, type I [Malonomonas rubra DSM 5091]|uniref:Methionine aminopeptidase n=1 Tax=Malonomonas rubra DSM 5091 TaxID=1122189 RepID=A0A1M6MTR9_MALRU|nr:type I methionyl aminopeptidase [Malonomonas rubra]SHJ86908.1 methionine aminopeptidase, type I [Malonomonas rubra DSM 5091]
MIVLKSKSELEKMRKAGRLVAEMHQLMREKIKPGVTTLELDRFAEAQCKKWKARPAFKGYGGFPFTICASPNEQVVHGFPNKQPLREGDILSIDFGLIIDGFYGDSAVTIPVGKIDETTQRLLDVTKESLEMGIAAAEPGKRLSDISHAVQTRVELDHFSVVREFVGHGIGRQLHEEPQIPNYGPPGRGPQLKPGMTLAIEPMVNIGLPAVKVLEDGWTAVTIDGRRSAHFEHTIAITENGPEILTCLDD